MTARNVSTAELISVKMLIEIMKCKRGCVGGYLTGSLSSNSTRLSYFYSALPHGRAPSFKRCDCEVMISFTHLQCHERNVGKITAASVLVILIEILPNSGLTIETECVIWRALTQLSTLCCTKHISQFYVLVDVRLQCRTII